MVKKLRTEKTNLFITTTSHDVYGIDTEKIAPKNENEYLGIFPCQNK